MLKSRRLVFLFVMCIMPLQYSGLVYAQEENENGIYDSINEKITSQFHEAMEQMETQGSPIEISGNFLERILRQFANVCYRDLDSIKAGCLLIGVFSFIGGLLVAQSARLNKGLRRYAISLFVITIPVVLFILVFALSAYIDMFI